MRFARVLLISVLLLATLTGCSELFPRRGANAHMESVTTPRDPDAPRFVIPDGYEVTQPPEDYSAVEQLSMTVTEKTIRELEKYPNLKSVDLSGSSCYTAIMIYIRSHPDVNVTYSVDFGNTLAINWAENIVIPGKELKFSNLLKNLAYLPNLKSVYIRDSELTGSELTILRGRYPDLDIVCTVEILGRELSAETEVVDLSAMTAGDIPEAIEKLPLFPEKTYVELMAADGTCTLGKEQVAKLVAAVPTVRFHYEFELFGRTVSSTEERITFKKLNLSPSDEPTIREALSLMAPGTALILDNCGLKSELLASIREDYPNVELAWRVFFGLYGRYSNLTNDETIRAVYNVTNDTCSEMQYLRGAKYIDMGHNDSLTDVSFLAYMPNLEILILSGSVVTDLSGIENCKKLEFLELANCLKLEDISPLEGCSGLKYLNICKTKVSSLAALEHLPIKNLFCKVTKVNAEEQTAFKQAHPGSTAVFTGVEPYAGPGWRYVDNGYTYTDFYKRVREVFNLDAVDALIRAQESQEE